MQMSASELNEELQYARETNPLLEMKDESEPEPDFRCEELPELIEDNLNAIDSGSGAVAEVGEIDIAPLQFDQLSDPDKSIWDDPQNYTPVDQRRASLEYSTISQTQVVLKQAIARR